MTVQQLLHQMDSRELTEWMAYYSIEPWGEERGDLRAGIISATVANRGRGKGEKAHKPEDFMPFRDVTETAAAGPDPAALRNRFLSLVGGKRE